MRNEHFDKYLWSFVLLISMEYYQLFDVLPYDYMLQVIYTDDAFEQEIDEIHNQLAFSN